MSENTKKNTNPPKPLPTNKEPIEKSMDFKQIFAFLKSFFWDIIDLEKGVDKAATIEEIKNKKSMAGANAWMLMCSIMIASLGLDRNSPAVIIGAMLISPLMSPILGLGLGVGINDREVIKTSLLHFSVAIFIAILVSTLYFVVTPLGEITSEIVARTEPTILDVMIAFFGGIAGIISLARKDISTTIPGVAIATALMPPLCVVGYGIANLQADIVLSSFYLFFSNTFFIVLSTYIIVRLLDFPLRRYMNTKERRRNRAYVVFFSLITIIPSFLIMRNVIGEARTEQRLETFINKEFGEDRKYLEDYLHIDHDTLNELILKVYGSEDSEELRLKYEDQLAEVGLSDWDVTILPTSEVNLERVARLETQIDDADRLISRVDSIENVKSEQQSDIKELKLRLKQNMLDSTYFADICIKTKEKFPELEEIAIGNIPFRNFIDSTRSNQDIVVIEWTKSTNPKSYRLLEEKLRLYLEGRLDKDDLILLRQ